MATKTKLVKVRAEVDLQLAKGGVLPFICISSTSKVFSPPRIFIYLFLNDCSVKCNFSVTGCILAISLQ